MSYPINLSITGKPSPRTDHPASAGSRRAPMTANRIRNQKSNIFCLGSDLDQMEKSQQNQRSSSIVTKSELEAIKDLTSRKSAGVERRSVAAERSPRKPPPKGVPQLSLDDVCGVENDNTYSKLPTRSPKLGSPTSLDTFSWGTPVSYPSKQYPVKGGGWQVNQSRKQTVRSATSSQRKHEDVPDLDLKLSQSNEGLGQLRQAAKDVREDLNIEYMGTKQILNNNNDKTSTNNHSKKQEFIEQAILQDQVARMKLADEKSDNSSSTTSLGGFHQQFDSRSKRVDQLFNTRSMVTGTHEDLSKRFRFTARILSLNGRDALRELNGFFFNVDNTLTVYEFRQFGSRANALPFIQRGQYSHVCGYRKNRAVTLMDIRTGADLSFETQSQPTLSDSLKSKRSITLRVTGTDCEETRDKLMYHTCKTREEKEKVKRFIDDYMRGENNDFWVALRQVQGKIRQSLQSRGTKMMTSLFHHFKMLDKSGDGLLSKDEIKAAFQKFRIQVSDYDFDMIWKLVDENSDGDLDYGEFVRGFFGEMNESRKQWVRKAFTRLDPTTTGVGEAGNFYKFFCAAKHPSVVKGEISEPSLISNIEEIFQITKRKREIQYQIFEAYYEGMSLGTSSDDQFVALLKSTWSLT